MRWKDHSAKITFPSFDEGGCIGFMLDMEKFTLEFFMNGNTLGEMIVADLHGGRESWMDGLVPTAYFESGSGVYWNFGESPFAYPGISMSSSFLEALRGSCPPLNFQVRRC